jgi:hypothetical protein
VGLGRVVLTWWVIVVEHPVSERLNIFRLGLRNDRFRNGDRQERRSVRISIPSVFSGYVLTGLDTLFTMISRRAWNVRET